MSTPQPVVEDRSDSPLAGVLYAFIAFDWGDEINLEQAGKLVPSSVHDLTRRRRTPLSIAFRPPPLRVDLPPVALELPGLGKVEAEADATVFDFAAVSLGLRIPFLLSPAALTELAGSLADSTNLTRAACAALKPLHQRLLPTIQDPLWRDDLSEEYFVFQFPPGAVPDPAALLERQPGWLAGLLRLESGTFSPEEIGEATRLYLRYTPEDLIVADWAAAVLLDRDCEETLQTVEFANLQLLEYRHIDNRLDELLGVAYGTIHTLARSRLPFWRTHARSLRYLGQLKVEANGLFERTGTVFKVVGDQYLARVYRLLAARFHVEEWERSIRHKLEAAEGVYQVVADQSATYRAEFLEWVIIALIAFEIVMAFVRPH